MDIILTNSIIIGGIAAASIVILAISGFMLYLRHKRKKYNILKIKQYGGVNLSDEDRNFLIRNKNIVRPVRKRIKMTFSTKNIKKKFADFFNKYNPSWYKEKIAKLEKEVQSVRRREWALADEVTNLKKAEESKNPVKKPETVGLVKAIEAEKVNGRMLAEISTFA